MEMESIMIANKSIQILRGNDIVLKDVSSALDVIGSTYGTDCAGIVIDKRLICPEFFDLSTKIAGDVFQKFMNYMVRLVIVGDFSHYPSKSLHDFIYETNKGSHIFFLKTEQEAIEKLSQ